MGRFHNTNFSLFIRWNLIMSSESFMFNRLYWQDEKKGKVYVNEHVHAVKYFKFLYDNYRSTRMKYLYYCVMTVRRFKDDDGGR